MIVDDSEPSLTIARHVLSAAYEVVAVKTAAEAIAVARQESFDVAVLDINLGEGMTGTELLPVLLSLPGCASAWFVALTAYALPGDREQLLEAGFDHYVAKPFTRQELLSAVACGR